MNITQIIRDIVTGVTFHALIAKTSITSLDELFIVDSTDSNKLKKVTAGNVIKSGVRQTIQTGLKDANGYCAITATSVSLTLTLLASTTDPVTVHAWGGATNKDRWCEILTDMTLSLPASQAAVYCYIDIDQDGTPTLGYTLLAPNYQWGGTISTVNGQFTCDIAAGKCYVGVSGTSYVQVWRVFFQESVTSASAITSVVNYALNGMYESAFVTPLLAASSSVSKNHNLGINEALQISVIYKNITTDGGFTAGDRLTNIGWYTSFADPIAPFYTNKIVGYSTNTGTHRSTIKGGGSGFSLDPTKWSYGFIVKRGW